MVEPKPLPPIKDLFTRTWDGYKRRLRSIITVYAWASVSLLGVVAVSAVLFVIPVIAFPPAAIFVGAFGFLVFMVALFLVAIFFQSAALETATHDGVAPKEAFARAKKDWKAFAWMDLASGLLGACAFGLFLIPGFILLPALRLAEYVFKVEGKKGIDAVLHAHASLRGRWWAVAGRMILFGFLVGIVPQILDAALPPIDPKASINALEGTINLLQLAYAFFFAGPLAMVFGAELFHDVKSTVSHGTEQTAQAGRGKWMAVAVVGAVVALTALVVGTILLGPLVLEALDGMKI